MSSYYKGFFPVWYFTLFQNGISYSYITTQFSDWLCFVNPMYKSVHQTYNYCFRKLIKCLTKLYRNLFIPYAQLEFIYYSIWSTHLAMKNKQNHFCVLPTDILTDDSQTDSNWDKTDISFSGVHDRLSK